MSDPQPTLSATYTSPTHEPSKTFTHPLSLSQSPQEIQAAPLADRPVSTESRTAHLAALGNSLKDLQGELNAFLTARMEEEKRAAGALNGGDGVDGARGGKRAKHGDGGDEELDEENYGEEGELGG